MKKVIHKAEYKAQDNLQTLWEDGQNRRCLIISLSDAHDKWRMEYESIFDIVFDTLNDDQATYYKFFNSDILIESRYLSQQTLGVILTRIDGLYPDLDIEQYCTIYDLNKNWSTLRTYLSGTTEAFELELKRLEKERLREKKQQKLRHVRNKFMEMDIPNQVHSAMNKKRIHRDDVKIMVIDDDEFSSQLLEGSIGELYDINASYSAVDGFRSYTLKAPNILFLDIEMPGVSGHDFLAKIFDLDPDAYIIMLSGNGDSVNVRKAMNLGAKGFVKKPFSRQKVLDYIEKYEEEYLEGRSIQ